MDNDAIVTRISHLVDEEHRLNRAHAGEGITDEDRTKLGDIEVQLDQAWDLLRQRRAEREFGANPGDSSQRPASTVEGYKQ